jgi:hypothetical protein
MKRMTASTDRTRPPENDGLTHCPDCQALVPETDGPTHPYIGANPGCWGIYGEVLAREYGDHPKFQNVHRLTVDAYAVQHPGKPERRSIQSINVHLVALYLMLEKRMTPTQVTQAMGRLIEECAESFEWLEPPAELGKVKVTSVWLAETPEEHARTVQVWARSCWDAWSAHHPRIAALAERVL